MNRTNSAIQISGDTQFAVLVADKMLQRRVRATRRGETSSLARSTTASLLMITLFAGAARLDAQSQGQAPAHATEAQTGEQSRSLAQQQSASSISRLTATRQKLKIRSSADLRKSSEVGWQIVSLSCQDPSSVSCAQAAIAEVNLECTESGKFFRKGSTTWTWINFGLVIASSVFTGIGASTTIANAKVFTTLGASTALGAVATTATTNASADQGGLLAINSTLDGFLTFVQTGGPDGKAADPDVIYESAPIYAAKCTAAASSTGH